MRTRLKPVLVATVAALSSAPLIAQHAAPADGKEVLGEVRFEVSCSPEAQQRFHRAAALYHSFHWAEAGKTLAEIARLDPRCGMAYWAHAMVAADNPFLWPVSMKLKEGAAFIEKAKTIGAGTQRERDYIDALYLLYSDHANTPHRARALAYEEAMEKLAARYPDDAEAKILYALALSANHDLSDGTFTRPLKAAALLEPLFKSRPGHPGVPHYLIHSYDYPPIAHKGLEAAKRYSRVAADAPHAQHMPSHIFTRVGYWRESVAANQASIAAARGAIGPATHAWDYMAYAYLQMADDGAATRIWAEASKVRSVKQAALGQAFALSAIPARLALERGRWDEAAKVEPHSAIADSDWQRFPQALANVVFARALGAARAGDAAGSRKEIERLRELQARLTQRNIAYWAQQVDIQANIASAWVLRTEGKGAEALAAMRAAARQEDATEKNVVTPGSLLPARELLGDMLMELGQPAEALKEYEASIAKEPNRFRGLYGAALAAERSGDRARARAHYEKLASVCAQSDGSRPELARARQVLAQR